MAQNGWRGRPIPADGAADRSVVPGGAAEGFQAGLDPEAVDNGRIAVVVRPLEQRKRDIPVSETRVRERQVVGRHIALFCQRLNFLRQGNGFPLGRQSPWHGRARQETRIIGIMPHRRLKFVDGLFCLTSGKYAAPSMRRAGSKSDPCRAYSGTDRWRRRTHRRVPHPCGTDIDAKAERVDVARASASVFASANRDIDANETASPRRAASQLGARATAFR